MWTMRAGEWKTLCAVWKGVRSCLQNDAVPVESSEKCVD